MLFLLEIFRSINITCSATATAFAVAVIATVMSFFLHASKSILSYPTPCLEIIFSFFPRFIISPDSFAVLKEAPSQSAIFSFKVGSLISSIISNS
jgi:hypothetical protein